MKGSSESLPLDIHHANLAEWLISRQKLSRDFHKRLQVIQAKALEAAHNLPVDLKPQADRDGSSLDYSTAVTLRDTLAETAERTIFGGLTGAAGFWDKIVRAYEKENIFLGECSLTLTRNIDYEIPFLQRQISKQQQQLVDLERKQAEHLHSAVLAAKAYQKECESLGINPNGVDVQAELHSCLRELPGTFQRIADQLQSNGTAAAMQYYADFAAQNLRNSGCHVAAELLPTVHGVCSVSEGQKSHLTSERSSQTQAHAGKAEMADTAASLSGATSQHEPHGTQAEHALDNSAAMEISWDVYMAELGAADAATSESSGREEIIWDIDVTDRGGCDVHGTPSHPALDNYCPDAAHNLQGGLVQQLLDDKMLRGFLLDELHELLSFLRSRLLDMANTQTSAFVASASEVIQDISAAKVQAWLQIAGHVPAVAQEVQSVVGQLTDERTQQLLLFKTSERYLDRVTSALRQKAGQEAKFRRLAQEVEGKRRQVQALLSADASKLAGVVARTRSVKALVEQALTAQLKRRVIIMGDINSTLA